MSDASLQESDRPYWIAWSVLPGMRPKYLWALFERFGSLADAWHAPDETVRAALGQRAWPETLAARRASRADALVASVERREQTILCALEPDFPEPLREIPDPPAVLYVRGRLPDWRRAIAIVGARRATPYGMRAARGLAHGLAQMGAIIVSGAAEGIDAAAHAGALEAPGGITVGVLGCGLDHVYPAGHGRLYANITSRGALLSEHPPSERPTRYSFPRRNRLIAGLSQGVVVVEAHERSGSLITADFANEQGRAVFAVPGSIEAPGSAGPHGLLKDGAVLVRSAADILAELGWEARVVARTELSEPEAAILRHLGTGARSLDALVSASGEPASRLMATLLQLELDGHVVREPGQRFARRT